MFYASSICVHFPHLKSDMCQILRDLISGNPINKLNLNLPFTLGQEFVPDPILMGEIACAALVGVVFTQHTLWPVASMIPAAIYIYIYYIYAEQR